MDPDRVARQLKLSDLRLLRAVVDRGGIGKAAEHLNMTQPGVSKAIAAMERTLGVRLLDRSRHGVTPTIYGEVMLRGGVAAFDELRQSVVRLGHLANPNAGILRIACTQPLALGFVPHVIERMRTSLPGTRFRVVEGDERPYLRQRQIDVAITRPRSDPGDTDLDQELLFDDPLSVAVANNHPLVNRRKLSLDEIREGPWVIPYFDSYAGILIADAFRSAGLELPVPQVTSYAVTLAIGLVTTGPYFMISANSMLRLKAEQLSLKVLPVPFHHRPSPVVLVTLKNRTLSPLAEIFIQRAREAAKALNRSLPQAKMRATGR
jgi:DNA-binding transcriptional LysR family regulator